MWTVNPPTAWTQTIDAFIRYVERVSDDQLSYEAHRYGLDQLNAPGPWSHSDFNKFVARCNAQA